MTVSRGIYLLPNLLTTAALFSGFAAIIAAFHGAFSLAAMAIYLGIIFDGLDGRVARLTNTQSEFGVQFDSLSDMVVSGVAPALIVYLIGLSSLGQLGVVVAFIYLAATALRLARFNVQVGQQDARYFRGLPCPIAAAMLASFVWMADKYALMPHSIVMLLLPMLLLLSFLMVSHFVYYSFKKFSLKGKVPFVAVIAVLLLLGFISLKPPEMLCLIF
jgi:CDP-diacylglycerol--serine O-phosphatidyltransferase